MFCAIVGGEQTASLVYHDDVVIAILDFMPINPGHTLVVPREHALGLADLPSETAAHRMTLAQKVAAALYRSELKAHGVNLMLADGASAGQEVFHAH